MPIRVLGAINNPKRVLAIGGVAGAAGIILALQLTTPATALDQAGSGQVDAEGCAALKGKTVGGALINDSEVVVQGQSLIKTPFAEYKAPVSFCRIKATASSGPGSSIKLEVYLPPAWNGKLVGVGGGGLSGGLTSAALMFGPLMQKGYAGVATNAGHDDATDAAWAINAPIRIKDFGHNANHLGAVAAKATLDAYYGRPVTRAYFHGCSNGGRDAMILAQRYPADYDGIVAGAPAANYTGVMASFMRDGLMFQNTPGLQGLRAKLPVIRDAVIHKCDRLDGVADGVLEDPRACKFDPAELQCKPGQDAAQCLTQPEIGYVRAVYKGTYGKRGQQIYPGLPVSSEKGEGLAGWGPWFMGAPEAGSGLAREFYRGLVKNDLKWDPQSFALDADHAQARAKVGADVDAVDPNLTPFVKRGGKLIIYQGWEDPAIPAGATLEYYAAVRKRMGGKADEGVRLFMAPGMAHCGQGPGPSVLDPIGDIDRWLSSGKAPEQILAKKPDNPMAAFLGQETKTLRSRPLCAFPMTAHYNGSGSTDEAANFTCRRPTDAKA
jgi:feruloyl esterase